MRWIWGDSYCKASARSGVCGGEWGVGGCRGVVRIGLPGKGSIRSQADCRVCMRAQSLQLCPLFVTNPIGRSLSGSSVHWILQARILEKVSISSFRGSSQSRDEARSSSFPALADGFFTTSATGWSICGTTRC